MKHINAQPEIDADFEAQKEEATDEVMEEYGEYFETIGFEFNMNFAPSQYYQNNANMFRAFAQNAPNQINYRHQMSNVS